VETESEDYALRTRLNVRDADATVVFHFGPPTGGSALTVRIARSLGKPLLSLDLEACEGAETVARLRDWLAATRPRVLNVAGSRASQAPRIAEVTARVLREALRGVGDER
jgi:Circularly permutated YpsA SLOG family